MVLDNFWLNCGAAALCGIISGFGIGGGSLLMVWMTAVVALDQRHAQAINLLYFVPTAVGALFFHFKNKMICIKTLIPAVIAGCVTAFLFAWIANIVETQMLKQMFGIFLCFIGIRELLMKKKQ